jgi:cytochrome c-type biogenesis protein CcmE
MIVSRRAKIIIVLVIGVPMLFHLLYALWASPLTAYYVTVSELRDLEMQARAVRVSGEVVAGSIAWDDSRGELHFALSDSTQQLPVVYSGPAPDLFRAGVTAIVEGQLEQGHFLARELLLKCPHKYVDA